MPGPIALGTWCSSAGCPAQAPLPKISWQPESSQHGAALPSSGSGLHGQAGPAYTGPTGRWPEPPPPIAGGCEHLGAAPASAGGMFGQAWCSDGARPGCRPGIRRKPLSLLPALRKRPHHPFSGKGKDFFPRSYVQPEISQSIHKRCCKAHVVIYVSNKNLRTFWM